jgi:hypothetical protein
MSTNTRASVSVTERVEPMERIEPWNRVAAVKVTVIIS